MSTSRDLEIHAAPPESPADRGWQATPLDAEPVQSPLESFAARIKCLRARRSLSQHELAERSGVSSDEYKCLEQGRRDPTLTLLLGLAKALDVSLAELLKAKNEPPSIVERVQTLVYELRWRRASMARLERRFNRLLDRVRQEFMPGTEVLLPIEKVSEDLLASFERSETLRAWAGKYVQLVLEHCQGNKRNACRVLGISYHTLQAHLRYPLDSRATTMENASATKGRTECSKQLDTDISDDVESSEASDRQRESKGIDPT